MIDEREIVENPVTGGMNRTPKHKRRERGRGTPLVFDRLDWPKVQDTILTFVSGVYYVEDAVIAAGLSKGWWYKWQSIAEGEIERAMKEAEEAGSDNYHEFVNDDYKKAVEFVESVKKRQSMVIIGNAQKIKKANPLEYNARVRPKDWGRKDSMLLGNDPDNPLETNVRIYLPDNKRGPAKDESDDQSTKDDKPTKPGGKK